MPRFHGYLGLGVMGVVLAVALLYPLTAEGNPIPENRPIRDAAIVGLTAFAFAVEILVTSLVLICICQIERRMTLVAAIILLNLVSFTLFVMILHPRIGSIAVTELMIWGAESFAVMRVARMLGERLLTWPVALIVTFVGNLLSFLVGLAV